MLHYNPDLPLFSLHIPKTAGNSFENVLKAWFNDFNFPNLVYHPRLSRLMEPLNIDFFLQRTLGCGLYFHYSNEQLKKKPRRVPLGLKYGLFQNRQKAECVHGHFDPNTDGGDLFHFYPGASQFITFLRDPLEMQLSLFFYLKNMVETGNMYWQGRRLEKMPYDGDIDQWVEERGCYILAFLPFHFDSTNYQEIINKYFIHIGVTEYMQKSVDILAEKLGRRSMVVPVENVTRRNTTPSEESVRKFKEKHALEYLLYDYARSLNL